MDFPHTCFQVVNAPADLNIWQRLKMAFWVLRGREHVLSEVWIHRDEMKEFVDYIVSLVLNPNTTGSGGVLTQYAPLGESSDASDSESTPAPSG
jgi:hypothetical protein